MINYYEELSGEEQQRVKESIQLLYRQTFLLERKYDRKTKRYQINREYHRLATIYILLLKLIYDEQMSTVSTSVNAMTNLSEIHEKLNTYRLLKKQPSNTEIRRSLALLKRYQIVEPLDVLDELDGFSRLVIYPAIHVVLLGDDARALLKTFSDGDTEDDEPEI